MVGSRQEIGTRRGPPVLAASNISKWFTNTHALSNVSLELAEGEMRALVGANGSGKSTLVKILAGFHEPEAGARLVIRGSEVALPMGPSDFTQVGVACVHQDLGLLDGVSVAENLLSYEMARAKYMVRPAVVERTARRFLALVDADLPLRVPIDELSRSDRALVALARALGLLEAFSKRQDGATGVLLLDEITAFLPRHEVQALHEAVRRVRRHGHAVLFISHDLDEVLTTAATVTVLRNGRLVGTGNATDLTHDDLVRQMVGAEERVVRPGGGRNRGVSGSDHGKDLDEIALRVEGLAGKVVHDASFAVMKGEILGMTGLIGSGFDEVPYLLFGAQKASGGRIAFSANGSATTNLGSVLVGHLAPDVAMALGIGLVPGDRARQGLFRELEIGENVAAVSLNEVRSKRRLLSWKKMRLKGRQAMMEYEIVASGERALPTSLSGGNQQKVLLAKWLMLSTRLLLLHEPVQGVDVATRAVLVRFLRAQAARGVAIICATSDYELLAELCDRAVVFRNGQLASEVRPDATTGRLDQHLVAELSIRDKARK